MRKFVWQHDMGLLWTPMSVPTSGMMAWAVSRQLDVFPGNQASVFFVIVSWEAVLVWTPGLL